MYVAGLAGFMLGTIPGAPIVGYMMGAQFGFTGGLITRWLTDRSAASRAIEVRLGELRGALCARMRCAHTTSGPCLQEYPSLMAHHLRRLEPVAFGSADIQEWRKDLRRCAAAAQAPAAAAC